MKVYRLSSKKYCNDISGEGARKQNSNRWNSFGTPMLYTANSPALCAVELSKVYNPNSQIDNYYLIEIELPNFEPLTIDEDFFKNDWINDIHSSKKMGDFFINENEFLVLKVPSVWIQNCFNFLINPNHKDFDKVKIIKAYPFPFKGKLFE